MDYVCTYLASIVVLVSGILVYRFASQYLGQQGFSEYAISRRIIAFAAPAIFLGLGLAIPRQVAMSASRSGHGAPINFFLAAFTIISCMLLVFIVFANLFSDTLSSGDQNGEHV